MNAIMEGVRPEKPEHAARLGFTQDLWRMLEQCWLEDRSARPSVEDILPCLDDATLHWEVGAADPGNDDSGPASAQTQLSPQTGSPLVEAEGNGDGNSDPNGPNDLPSQQPTLASSESTSTCRLSRCNEPVFADDGANTPSGYCSQRHQE